MSDDKRLEVSPHKGPFMEVFYFFMGTREIFGHKIESKTLHVKPEY